MASVMDTSGLFVFRIKGKLALQVWIAYDMKPDGNPAEIAKFLLELVGEVQVHSLIITIVDILKKTVGTVYLKPTTESHLIVSCDSQYDYVIDFNDEVDISVTNCKKGTKTYNIPEFASLCHLKVPKLPHTMPTLKFDAPLEGKEFVQMINEKGKPFFFMAVKDWYKNVSRFVLGVDIHLGEFQQNEHMHNFERLLRDNNFVTKEQLVREQRHNPIGDAASGSQYLASQFLFANLKKLRDSKPSFADGAAEQLLQRLQDNRTSIGEAASGPQCLAAQILKKTQEVCGDDVLILADMKHDAMPMHTITLYTEKSDIAIHDESISETRESAWILRKQIAQKQIGCVQGIHSRMQNRIVFSKFTGSKAAPHSPSAYLSHTEGGKGSGHVSRVYHPSPPPSFIAWSVGSSRNRDNWQLTTVKQLRNVLSLITTFAHVYAPPRPSVKRIFCEKEEEGGKRKRRRISA